MRFYRSTAECIETHLDLRPETHSAFLSVAEFDVSHVLTLSRAQEGEWNRYQTFYHVKQETGALWISPKYLIYEREN